MFLSEILFSIKNLKPGGIQDDDMKLSDEQVIFMMEYYRARWIKQEYNKSLSSFEGLDQIIGKDGLVEVDESEEDKVAAGHAIDEWLITEEIPLAVSLDSAGLAVTYLGSSDGTNPYTKIKKGRAHLIKYARFTSEEGFWYPLGNRMVIKPAGGEDTDTVAITQVCANPLSALRKYDTDKELDIDFNFEYPLHSQALDGIIKMIHESEIKLLSIFPTDNVNDSRDTQLAETT